MVVDRLRAVLVFMLVAAATVAAAAQPADDSVLAAGRRVALVFGNANYDDLPDLRNPINDATALAESLERLQFDVTLVTDADVDAMRSAVRDFGAKATRAAVALVYYSGHGLQVAGVNYLIPVSAQIREAGDLWYEAVTLPLIMAELKEAEPDLSVLILDACRNNPLPSRLAAQAEQLGRSMDTGPGLASVEGATGMLIAYATAPGDVAYDGVGANSPFTKGLLEWIEQPDLEVGLMFRRVRESVVESTNEAQVPWVEESVLGEFYFNPDTASATPSEVAETPGPQTTPEANDNFANTWFPDRDTVSMQADIEFWRSITNSEDPADFEAYLEQFPEGVYALLASNRLDGLRRDLGAEDTTRPDNGGDQSTSGTEISALPQTEDAQTIVSTPDDATITAPQTPVETLSRVERLAAQRSLRRLGYYAGAIDAIFGAGTRRGIREFQASAGFAATGYLSDPEQVAALHSAAAAAPPLPTPTPPAATTASTTDGAAPVVPEGCVAEQAVRWTSQTSALPNTSSATGQEAMGDGVCSIAAQEFQDNAQGVCSSRFGVIPGSRNVAALSSAPGDGRITMRGGGLLTCEVSGTVTCGWETSTTETIILCD